MRTLGLSATALVALFISGTAASAQTEIQWWHSMAGELGQKLEALATGFNETQSDYRVVPLYRGTYPESMTAAIAAFRANEQPHLLQVFEVGTGTFMAAGEAIYPVQELMGDTGKTFDPESYLPAVTGYYQTGEGTLLSFPFNSSSVILYYNKEIFAKKNVAVPKTMDEMVAAAEKLNDPAAGIYGFTGRGLRNANMTLWSNFFLNYGGEFLDAKGNILTDGPESIEATKVYQRLMMKSAPPGAAGFNWMESMASLTQGRAAMWIDGVGWAPPFEGPNASRVVGKIGYTLVPAGPRGQYSSTYGDGIGIAKTSKNKEAAYLYCQWAVSKQMGARLLQTGGGVPFRNSILNDAEVRKGVKNQEWLQSVIDSAKISKLGLPVIIPVAEFRDLVGAGVTATLAGADPAAELKKAHEQFRPILERSEKS